MCPAHAVDMLTIWNCFNDPWLKKPPPTPTWGPHDRAAGRDNSRQQLNSVLRHNRPILFPVMQQMSDSVIRTGQEAWMRGYVSRHGHVYECVCVWDCGRRQNKW